jgi:hypothetical protein
MAAGFILITATADITLGDFLHNVFSCIGVHWGAAQDMDLFLNPRPLFVGFMQREIRLRYGFWWGVPGSRLCKKTPGSTKIYH